jgi:hypothetical protein
MDIAPNGLGKFAFESKFIGIIPRRLAEDSQGQEIDFYVLNAPKFKFEDFTIDQIKQQKLMPKRVASLRQLAGDLGSLGLDFDHLTVLSKVESSVTGNKLTVKNLRNGRNTTVECTCPCTVEIDKIEYGCN